MIEPILASVVAALASMLAGFVSALRRRQLREREEEERSELRKYLTSVRLSLGPVSVQRAELPDATIAELVDRVQEQIADRIATRPGGELPAVKRELDQELADFRDRIARIEDRFPDDSELDKIASINDALLSERIDQLSKRVEALEGRTLTKWDVGLVISGVIGGISAVVATTVAVLRFFAQ